MRIAYLYTIRPVRPEMPSAPTPAEAAAYEAHVAYYETLERDGTLILAGRTDVEDSIGYTLIRAGSLEEAERIMRADPFVARGVVHAELRPFRLAHFMPENAPADPDGE